MPRFALLSVLLPVALTAQRPTAPVAREPISAPIADIHYSVAFDRVLAADRLLDVRMEFSVTGPGDVLLSLPSWTPGAYEVSNFARQVRSFEARANGTPLRWDKLDFDTWRVRPAGQKRLTIRFSFRADTLDNAMAWAAPDFAFFNGTNLFPYAEGRSLDVPATVSVRTEPGWRIVSGMSGSATTGQYAARTYHELVDMPFFIGEFDVDSMRIADRWVRLATYPMNALNGENRTTFWGQQGKVLPAMGRVFGSTPYDTYTTLIVFDSTYAGASALEHANSHLGIYTPFIIGQDVLPSITTHEMIHLWNVKRMRPIELWPYRYDRPMPTTWLWVSEGITDYYADLLVSRSGVADSLAFTNALSQKMESVNEAPAVALEDASLSTWIHPTDGTGYLYYDKGALIGFLLDVLIRDASDGRASLDDVMRSLYAKSFGANRGFTPSDWWGEVQRLSGRSFTEFADKYIDGREPLPWSEVLPKAGMRLISDTVRSPQLGISTVADSTGVRVRDVFPGSAAAEAGVRVGDLLLKVGDLVVADPSFGGLFRSRYARAMGREIPIVVQRDGVETTLPMKVRMAEMIVRRIEFDPNAAGKAARLRAALLRGS